MNFRQLLILYFCIQATYATPTVTGAQTVRHGALYNSILNVLRSGTGTPVYLSPTTAGTYLPDVMNGGYIYDPNLPIKKAYLRVGTTNYYDMFTVMNNNFIENIGGQVIGILTPVTSDLSNATVTVPIIVGNGGNIIGGIFQKQIILGQTGSATPQAISLSGTINFTEGITTNGPANITIQPGTVVNLPGGQSLNFNQESTALICGSTINGNLNSKSAFLTYCDTTVNGTSVHDPTLARYIGTNTIANLTLGTHSPEDSWNVTMMDPGSLLNVPGVLTLNNQNVLVVGYNANSITTRALSDLITAAVMQGGNVTDSGRFDYVFTLGLNEDGSSNGILQPIDATITNNTSTYAFNVVQSNSGVDLSITSGAQPSAGSNLDSIVQELLAANPAFAQFLGYNSTASAFSFRVDSLANSLLGSVESARGRLDNIPVDQVNDEFRFVPVQLSQHLSTEQKFEQFLKTLAEGGPISKSNDEYRIWVSPFSDETNEKGSSASRSWLLGSLLGTEYRSKSDRYTLGILGGMHFGNGRSKIINQNGTNIKGINAGGYGAWGAWEGGRIDAIYLRSLNWLKESRFAGLQGIALNDHKVTVDMIDLSTSHVFHIPGNIWSVRLNIGHTYSYSHSQGYKEYNIREPRLISSSIGRSYEVYGGVGLRWNRRYQDWRARITGVYEYGKEYRKAGSTVKTSHGATLNLHTFSKDTSPQAQTHYVTCYGSLNNKEGWKFLFGYQGAIQKNIISTTLYGKIEHRF